MNRKDTVTLVFLMVAFVAFAFDIPAVGIGCVIAASIG